MRILIVDDRRDILEFARIALGRAGYEVHTAENGRQAIELQRDRPADLLVTDIFMPDTDGMETVDRFKADFPSTRIIAMSAGVSHMQDYLAVAEQIGVDATLRKPFTVDQLLAAVRAVLGGGASER